MFITYTLLRWCDTATKGTCTGFVILLFQTNVETRQETNGLHTGRY
jgi:hypothetical protein